MGPLRQGREIARTRLSAAVLATLALLVATLARVIPVALEPMDETDWLSSSSSRSANTLRDGALCRFSFMTRCFHASAVCELYMLYWRPLIAIEGLSFPPLRPLLCVSLLQDGETTVEGCKAGTRFYHNSSQIPTPESSALGNFRRRASSAVSLAQARGPRLTERKRGDPAASGPVRQRTPRSEKPLLQRSVVAAHENLADGVAWSPEEGSFG